MKVIIYARFSSHSQNEQSIEGQLNACYEYAKREGHTVCGEYIDRAVSGTTDNRPEFQKMITDSAKKAFQGIIVYQLDRFARNRYDSATYKAKLKKNGVRVISARENITDDASGILMEAVLEGMAEYYSVELSQKIRRGMDLNAQKCLSTGGNIALGYKIAADKTFEIDPVTAPIVQKIFAMFDTGSSVIEICNELNSIGCKTSRGGTFNKNSLRTILKNKKYIGIYSCKTVEIAGGVPAIISRELFDRTQLRVVEIHKAPGRGSGKIEYLLSGKLFCGECNSSMTGISGTGRHGDKHYYYQCTKKRYQKTCAKVNVKKDWLEDIVARETCKYILKPTMISKIAKRCVEISKNDTSKNDELNNLSKKLHTTKKSINNLMTAIEEGIITKTTKSRLSELEQIEEQIEYKILLLKELQPNLTEKRISFMLNQFRNSTLKNSNYNKELFDCLVSSVYLFSNRIIVTYNLTNKKTELKSSILLFTPMFTNTDTTMVCMGSSLECNGEGGGS